MGVTKRQVMLLQIFFIEKGRRLHMKKDELVTAAAEKLGTTKKEARTTLESVFEVFGEALADGNKVTLEGIGNLDVRHRKARKGRNPQTGEEIEIPASNTIGLKVSKAGKELVN